MGHDVIHALANRCSTIEATYGLCHRTVSTPHVALIYAASLIGGGLLGWLVAALFSPTLKQFAGTGENELPGFRVRGEFARIEWASEGGIHLVDRQGGAVDLRSTDQTGSWRIRPGRYALRVSAPGNWIVRLSRG